MPSSLLAPYSLRNSLTELTDFVTLAGQGSAGPASASSEVGLLAIHGAGIKPRSSYLYDKHFTDCTISQTPLCLLNKKFKALSHGLQTALELPRLPNEGFAAGFVVLTLAVVCGRGSLNWVNVLTRPAFASFD